VRRALALLGALLAVSCQRDVPSANPHYVLGQPYQAGGSWYYPRESFEASETGLAVVYPSDHATFTADGEVYDPTAMAAAHQTLQLPAIARVTNLENGRQILVRINDRGPATPHRMIELTRRAARLLGMPADGVARVRLQVLPRESQDAVDAAPGAPSLGLTAAPRGAVEQSDLPPLGGAVMVNAAPRAVAAQPAAEAIAAPVLRLPEKLTQTAPEPGQLFIQLSTFQNYQYADIQRARVGGLGARIVSTREGRVQTHRVIIGPFTSVQQADVMLDQVLRAGVTDARIVVE
jgi:rare lipoprotein A